MGLDLCDWSARLADHLEFPAVGASAPERKKVLALAQARKVGVILVTELTSWAVRFLTCFKFRFVSSTLLVPTFTMQRLCRRCPRKG
jgi:hypothetical protein